MAQKIAYHANCWGPLGGHPVGVTSIKDLVYQTFGDMNRAFADIAAAGYHAVELFDGNLLDFAGRMGELRGQLRSKACNSWRSMAVEISSTRIFSRRSCGGSSVLQISPPRQARYTS